MKKGKKIILFIILIFAAAAYNLRGEIIARDSSKGLQLEISIIRDSYIIGEPVYVIAKLKNISSETIIIPGNSFKEPGRYDLILIDGPPAPYKSMGCGYSPMDNIIGKAAPIYIEAGKEIINRLVSGSYFVTSSINAIGNYKVTYKYEVPEFRKSAISFWSGKLVASVSFDIVEPKGIDALHLRDYLKKFEEEKVPEEARCYHFISDSADRELLSKYPTSIYSTWIYYNNMWTPRKTISEGSSDIQKSIDRAIRIAKGEDDLLGAFPDPDASVTDKYGFRRFRTKKEAAEYYKQKAIIILKYHPDFVFADQVRLGLSIAEIVLGNEAEGIKQIQDFVQKKQKEAIQQNKEISFEGKWAEEFLKKWFQQKL